MQGKNLAQFSNTRLPLDHVLSGALLASITTIAYDIASKDKNPKETAIRTLKNGLAGGIAAGVAIHAANSLVNKNYIQATLSVAIGVAGVMAVKNLIKAKE